MIPTLFRSNIIGERVMLEITVHDIKVSSKTQI